MRKREAFERSRRLFDQVFRVDRSAFVAPEPAGSMELTHEDEDVFLDNNGCLDQLEAQILEAILG
ncbi:MAG: hypothetical protein CML66_16410 [Rhodobacteraceae bacterium]|nr:hypothetical protein [Paracoccaceae bacterium]MAY44848.1 hypothetical protein [Paracoccaceae bacterium]